MIAALVNGKLARATHGAPATCPECKGSVYARLPAHAINHWAHKPLADGEERRCSRDAGEMSEWHRAWQSERTDLECVEVVGDGFRADVKNAAGIVIEFQRSRIPSEEITRRERYWRKGVWVVDGTPNEDSNAPRVRLERLPDQTIDDPYYRFRWSPAPPLLYVAKWPVWIDTGAGLIQMRYAKHGRGGGWMVDREWFVREVVNGTRATLRPHVTDRANPKPGNARAAASRPRREIEEDLSDIPVYCTRPMPDVPCCGDRLPGIAGEPIVLACQLCPASPTYWRKQGGE